MLSPENIKQIEEILLNPVHAPTVHDAIPFTLSPEAQSGKLKTGDRLMVPVGEVRHRTSSSFMDKSPDGDRFKAGPEKYRFEHEHTGFWSRISTVTLFLPIEFRGMTPVWMFVLSGCFTKSDNSDFDRDLIERVDSHVHEAHRQTFQMRRNGDTFHYFRAPNYTADNLSYNSHWVGDFKDFNGVEKVTLGDASIVWRANFFGRLIDPIS